jgi:uncharacterized protein (TIGR03067 family)
MRTAALFLFAVLSSFAVGCGKSKPTPAPPDSGPGTGTGSGGTSDQDRLQGVWKVESVEPGNPTESPPPDLLASFRINIKGDRIWLSKEGENDPKSSFVLDTASNPNVIIHTRLDAKGQPARIVTPDKPEGFVEQTEWIYKFDGETLVLAIPHGPGARPHDFKATPARGEKLPPPKSGAQYIPAVDVVRLKKTNESVDSPPPPRVGGAKPTMKGTAKN